MRDMKYMLTLGFQIDHKMGKKFTRLENDIDIGSRATEMCPNIKAIDIWPLTGSRNDRLVNHSIESSARKSQPLIQSSLLWQPLAARALKKGPINDSSLLSLPQI